MEKTPVLLSGDEELFHLGNTNDVIGDSSEDESDFSPKTLLRGLGPNSPLVPTRNDSELDFFGAEEDTKKGLFGLFFGFSGDGATRTSYSWYLLRYPLFMIFCSFIAIDLLIYFTIRHLVSLYEALSTGTISRIHKKLRNAPTYSEYCTAAIQLDSYMGNDEWKRTKSIGRLHRHRLDATTSKIASERIDAVTEMIAILRQGGCKANTGNIDNETLYSHSFIGTKVVVQEYYTELEKSLHFIADFEDLGDALKEEFFRHLSRVYGRTALCLSGGAALVFTGTSAGALIAALVCCRTDDELIAQVFTPDVCLLLDKGGTLADWENIKRLYRTGALFDFDDWYTRVTKNITFGEMTFLEAYQKTGRILNITIVLDTPFSSMKVCNYVSTPDVVIASAVIASAAIPHILLPVTLYSKGRDGKIKPYTGSGAKWRDGSLRSDIPERELHQMFDIKYTIVSQTNPHILIFFYERLGSAGVPVLHRRGKGWRGGFIASSLTQHFKLDMQKWLYLLRDLSLTPLLSGTDMSEVFSQNYVGSATICPPASFIDYMRIIADPNRDQMDRIIRGGEASSFRKLGMIGDRIGVERVLKECRGRVGRRRKIPPTEG